MSPTSPSFNAAPESSSGVAAPAETGGMRQRVRELDWSRTPLGPMTGWPLELRAIVDTVLSAAFPHLVLWGPELVQIYNDRYAEVIGRRHADALGQPIRESFSELWHTNRVLFGRVMAGETVTFEDERYDFDRAAGVEEAYFTASHSPIRLADGTVGGVLTTVLETTNRVRSQQMQAEREHLLRELEVERSRLEEMFRQAPSFLGITRGPEHVMHFVNDTYMQLVGHRDIVGKRLIDAIPEVKEQGFIEILDRVLATGTPFVGREMPVKLQRTPGAPLEEIYVDLVYQPLVDADGTRFGIAAHGSDVTDQVLARREVEAVNRQLNERAGELRASEARLRDVFNQAPLAVAVLEGPDHVYTIASPRYRETPGSGRPLIGRPIRAVFPELEGQGFLETMDRVYETGEPFFANDRLVMLDRDGDGVTEPHWFNVGYQPLRDAAGTVYAIASVAYDVTEQVNARRELEIATRAAEDARVEAVTANQAKSAFLTTMSHELRTPLNAVAGYADLLLMGIRGPLADGQRADLERIRRSGQYLLGLINDVLNFAKLDAGQVEYRFEDVQVGALLEGIEEMIRPQVDAKGLRYSHGSCSPDLVMRADPEKAQQILLNLLVNSVKFTEAGGSVSLECTSEQDVVHISVHDTGRGIPPDQLKRVFNPFVQVDRHLTPMSQQGVGLGLAISRDLANGMGGTLVAHSVVGEGSKFVLTLPRVRRR